MRRLSLAIMAIFMAVPSCKDEPPPPAAQGPRPIKIYRLAGQGGDAHPEYPGRVQASQTVELSFEVAGRIVDWNVEEGQRVKKNQVLARIDASDYKAQLDAGRARFRLAKSEYDRQSKLFASGSATQRDLDVAVRQRDVASADVRISQKAVNDTQLKAIFAGVIARKLVTDFRNVQAREPVLLLQDDSGLEVVVDVPEGDLARRQRGNVTDRKAWSKKAKPVVELSSLPGKQFPATLKEFSTAADANTRTYRVTLSMERPEGTSILSGMTTKVIFLGLTNTPEEEQFVPAQAVVAGSDGEPFVWVIEQESMSASKRPVKVGQLSGDRIAVQSGLERGEAIAMTGVHKLSDGTIVREMEISDETRR